ncbi:hypothetical protein GCM10028819_00910 [Spirosoma humi]
MTIERIVNFVTPFRLVALIGILAIGQGFLHMDQRDNVLQFIFGIPLAAGMIGFDYLMRRATRDNTLYLWLVEAIIVALMWYGFNHS